MVCHCVPHDAISQHGKHMETSYVYWSENSCCSLMFIFQLWYRWCVSIPCPFDTLVLCDFSIINLHCQLVVMGSYIEVYLVLETILDVYPKKWNVGKNAINMFRYLNILGFGGTLFSDKRIWPLLTHDGCCDNSMILRGTNNFLEQPDRQQTKTQSNTFYKMVE